jgi:hypothetical protein
MISSLTRLLFPNREPSAETLKLQSEELLMHLKHASTGINMTSGDVFVHAGVIQIKLSEVADLSMERRLNRDKQFKISAKQLIEKVGFKPLKVAVLAENNISGGGNGSIHEEPMRYQQTVVLVSYEDFGTKQINNRVTAQAKHRPKGLNAA